MMNLEELRAELATTYRYLDSYEDVCRHHYQELAKMREERDALALELNAWKARRCETCIHFRGNVGNFTCASTGRETCAPNGFSWWKHKDSWRDGWEAKDA